MLNIQEVYPYGLNDRVGDEYMTENKVVLLGICCDHYIFYTNV